LETLFLGKSILLTNYWRSAVRSNQSLYPKPRWSKQVTFGIEPLGHALASPPNRLRIRFSGLDGELRALVKGDKCEPLKTSLCSFLALPILGSL
jgi:hypothetical protein